MSNIQFRIAAKTDVGLVRTNNEDNFQASSDLSKGQMRWINNEVCSLGDKGALIVVADGMGGMNAGEVASELAIETVREYFTPENLTPNVMKTRYSIEKFMNEVIIAADAKIKEEAHRNPETKGMGTTIVIGWILDGKLYVSWCGDSRAYVYNPVAGLHQISKDHSYVQGLVDKGTITREEAFDFPDSNIITRCLSDSTTKAKPESLLKPYEICNGDIILLCTDGLSGMIRDSEIEAIIRGNEQNMDLLVDELIRAACDAEGSDNITICAFQVLSGGIQCNPAVYTEYDRRNNGTQAGFIKTLINTQESISDHKKKPIYLISSIIAIALIGCGIWWFILRDDRTANIQEQISINETESISNDTRTEEAGNMTENSVEVTETDNTYSQTKQEIATSNTQKKDTVQEKSTKTKESQSAETQHENSTNPGDASETKDTKKASETEELTLITQSDSQPVSKNQEQPSTQEYDNYQVQRGDTYKKLAKTFNTDEKTLKAINNAKDDTLIAGKTIKVPKKKSK